MNETLTEDRPAPWFRFDPGNLSGNSSGHSRNEAGLEGDQNCRACLAQFNESKSAFVNVRDRGRVVLAMIVLVGYGAFVTTNALLATWLIPLVVALAGAAGILASAIWIFGLECAAGRRARDQIAGFAAGGHSKLTPERLRDDVLGRWSPHPEWLIWRRRWFSVGAFLTLFIVLRMATLTARHFDTWMPSVLRAPWLLLLVCSLLAFVLGGLMTIAMTARVGEWRAAARDDAPLSITNWPVDALLMSLAIVLGLVGPLMLAQLSFLQPNVRFMFRLFGLFPLLGIVLAMRMLHRLGKAQDIAIRVRVRRKRYRLVLLTAMLSLLALTVIHDLGVIYGVGGVAAWVAAWIPWYARWQSPLLGVALFGTLSYVSFAFWYLYSKRFDAEPDSVPELVRAANW